MQNSQHKLQNPFQQEFLNSFISFFLINGPRSKFSQYFQFLAAEIQFLAILIWMHTTSLGYEDDTTSFSFLHNISQRLAIRGIFENNMVSGLSKIARIYLLFICILVLYAIFKACTRQKLNSQLQTMMSSLLHFHSGFLFWVVNVILMTFIAAKWQPSNILRSYVQNQDQLLVITSLILIILNYGFGVLGAIFCFDPFCSTNIFAERISSSQILNFLFKAVLAPQAIFADITRAETQIFFVVITLLVSVVRLTILLRKFPFYCYKPMKLALIFCAIGLWISLINIITIICQKNGTSSPMSSFYLILVPLPIVVKVVLAKFESLIQFYVVAHPKSLQTTVQVYKKLFAYRYLAEKISLSLNENKPSSHYELYFTGNLSDHAKTCKDMDCFCQNYLNTADPGINSTKHLLPAYFSSAALSLLSESISKFRDNMDLKIALADLIFTRSTHGLTAALAYMFSAPQENVGFFIRVKKDILGRKIQERMIEYFTDNENSKLNLVKFIDYQSDSASFLSKITEVTNNYLEFWNIYGKSNLKISEVMSKSVAIENAADEVDKHWNVSIEKYESFYHHMKNQYRLYLSLVRNMPYASNQIINKFKWKKRLREPDFSSYQLTHDDLNSSKLLTIHISMARERLGRITSVSENIQGPTEYTSRDLIGKNISFLMPSCIAEKHDELLLRRLDRLKRTSQTEDSHTWPIYIKTKAGHILSCSAYVTLFPYIQQELIYTAIIKVITSKYEYIITDSMGYIDGYTEALGTKLSLSSEKREHIKEICPNVCKVYSKLDKNFLEISSQENSRTAFNSFNKSQVSNAIDEVNTLDGFSNGVPLTFIRKQSPDKSYRYLSKLNKKVLINKSVYIFQLEPSYDGRQDQKTLRDYAKKPSHKYTFEESDLDIPIEKILSTDIPIIPDIRSSRVSTLMKSDSLLKTGFIFKTIDSQGDMIPFTRINTTHAPTFSYTNEKSRVQRNSNVYSTASNHDLKEEKISIPSPVANKRLDRMFSEGGRSTASTVSNVSNKLEKAIYSLPKNKAFSKFKVLSEVLIVVNIALLAILCVKAKTNLTSVKENISVISTSNLRLFQITELNRRVRGISLYENGLIDDQRYLAMGIMGPLLAVIMPYISLIEVDLNNYNNIVRQAIEQIDTGLQKRLFAKHIQIVDPNTTEDKSYRNVFDATASLIVQAKQVSEIPYDQISQENSQMNYILNNTLNEQLIVGEEIIDVLLNDSEIKLQDLENLSIYFIITTCLLGIIMTIFFNSQQFKFLKSRNRFIEIFLRLNKNEIEKNMKNVRALKNALTNNGRDFKDIEFKESHSNQHAKDSKTAKSFVKSSTRARSANKSGINCSLFSVQVLGLCIFILTIVPFLSTLLLLKSQTHLINKFVNYIVGVNQNLFQTNLLGAAMGEYIQLNGTTTLLNQPIGEEFEATLATLYASQSLFTDLLISETDLMKSVNKTERDQLDLLLSGNLCNALELPEINCAFAQGILEKGIIGMSSFILSTFRLMKDTYDMSNKSFASAKNTLTLPESIDLDIIFTLTQLPAYQKAGAILEAHVDGQIDDTKNAVKLIIIVSVVVGMILGYVLTKWLWKIVENERVNWKKFMRKIPFSIAVSDKAFKNYLVRESDHLLDSVKDNM